MEPLGNLTHEAIFGLVSISPVKSGISMLTSPICQMPGGVVFIYKVSTVCAPAN